MRLAERYGFSVHDAMIVASALHAGRDTLWSADMLHGMTLDEGPRIVDPFRDQADDGNDRRGAFSSIGRGRATRSASRPRE